MNNIYECPYCGFFLKFNFNKKRYLYRAVCAYCEEVLEIEKEEFERDKEIYFLSIMHLLR